ncbi:MAG TPA: RNA 2',3'-cyclic phosphodiesterase [Candidatus Binataceae bacterium]|nr:RNA 2',3'-cyclic phosphodiesterase [Candidatus Binataceae bacterium]
MESRVRPGDIPLRGEAMPEPVRAFVAIRLAPEVDAAIARFQAELRPLGADISWPVPANFHLTLRFLGNRVAPGVIENVIFRLRPIAAATAAMMVRARGAGAFPSLNRPRVIWVGLADEALAQAAAKVEAVCVRCGLEPEKRGFAPHLTIGRVRNPSRDAQMREAIEAAAERDFGGSTVASMTVYRSRLSPRGATYEVLATLPLEG